MRRWLLVTIGLGAVFLANQIAEYAHARLRRRRPPVRVGLLAADRAPRRPRDGRHLRRWRCCSSARSVPAARGAGAVGRRGLAVLAPRRRHLDLRLLDDLADPVRAAAAGDPVRWRPRGRRSCAAPAGARPPAPDDLGADAVRRRSAPPATATDGGGVEDRGPTLADEGRGRRRLRPAHRAHAAGRPRHAGRTAARCATPRRRSSPSSTTPARSATARTSPTSTRRPATSPAAPGCTSSTARPATSPPAPGRRSAAGARRPT